MVAQIPSLLEAFKRYAKEQDVAHFDKLEEVILDGLSIPVLGDLSFLKDCNVGFLSLNNCQVGAIDHPFPEGTKIERLELNSNNLSDRKSLEALGNLKETLQELHLANNKLAELDALIPLHKLVNIRILNLIDNPVDGIDNDEQMAKAAYREDLLNALPNLQVLDGYDRNGEEVLFEDSEPEDDEDAYTSDSEDDDEDVDGEQEEEEEEEDGADDDENEEVPHAKRRKIDDTE
ncbi:U2 snrnp-specific A' protein, putative [Perkinsus marinus ATCC 50983]|uniref:U2 snrnp-specific A' protein, putative n=1 Tax=Perkinsus marinus (strain ATCC 50983 / TXsc) TaxID=423536 RepID=C5L675_PERM5|nr:U2 snrnp-specific A' protein, putative [Perkinsus marinus ATCC 50983]EER07702.1 U2 snrnp-specific A' protein, putative [Perkinsus marinus ATCC 50983]|eukprot:XP_002775886.1 U2 snrnp-specific A' protein, putative [Perkinsus marinus ATCC 50983]